MTLQSEEEKVAADAAHVEAELKSGLKTGESIFAKVKPHLVVIALIFGALMGFILGKVTGHP